MRVCITTSPLIRSSSQSAGMDTTSAPNSDEHEEAAYLRQILMIRQSIRNEAQEGTHREGADVGPPCEVKPDPQEEGPVSAVPPAPARTRRLSTQADIERCAERLLSCNTFLIAAGAGMGKDSGLPTFAEFGDKPLVKSYDYGLLCSPFCRDNDYEAFMEFWDGCKREYAQANAHEGYEVLDSWLGGDVREGGRRCGPAAETSDGHVADGGAPTNGGGTRFCKIPHVRTHHVYTSNVDGHFRRFPRLAKRLAEIHGCCEDDKEFLCVRERRRKRRPRVLMFCDDDDDLVRELEEGVHTPYQKWEYRMEAHPDTRLGIIELGCGTRVPSVRRECEEVMLDFSRRWQEHPGYLLRINPEEDLEDLSAKLRIEPDGGGTPCLLGDGEHQNSNVCVINHLGGKAALVAIDQAMRAKLQACDGV